MDLSLDAKKRRLQRHELEARIGELRDHIKKFDPEKYLDHREAFAQANALCAAWREELREKQRLKLNLAEGRAVSQAEVNNSTKITQTLAKVNATYNRRGRENGMMFGPKK